MSIAKILPMVESLSHTDKLQLMQFLLTRLAEENGLSLQTDEGVAKTQNGPQIAAILHRMAQRRTLSHITDPVAWQKEMREDRPLPGRE